MASLTKYYFIVALAIMLAYSLLINYYIAIVGLFAFMYILLLISKAEIALFLTILVIFNCFSMMSEDLLRLPFLFRIRDVMFFSIWIPFLFGCYRREEAIKNIFRSPVAKAILCIFFIVLIQLFLTKLRFPQESLNSMIRMGRRYLYYGLFFPAMYILQDQNKYKRFVRISVTVVGVFSILYSIQFFLGRSVNFFPYGRVSLQNLSGALINRLYVTGVISVTLIFQILLMQVLFGEIKRKKLAVFLIILFGFQTVLTFGRAHIFGVLTGILFVFCVAKERYRFKKIFIFSLYIIVFIGLFSLGFSSFFPERRSPVEIVMTRIISTFDAVVNRDDTVGTRLEDSAGRLDLIEKHPILGIGFLHDDTDRLGFYKGTISRSFRTNDSGILSLMMDFGFFGVLLLLILSALLFKRMLHVYHALSDPGLRAVVLGIMSFYFGRLFSFITLAPFVKYDGIVVICLSLVMLELIALKGEAGGLINNHR